MRLNRIFKILLLLAVFLAPLSCQKGGQDISAQEPTPEATIKQPQLPSQQDPLIVTINGEEVHQSDLMMKLRLMGPQGQNMTGQQLLSRVIAEELLYQQAEEADVIASASEVNSEMDQLKQQLGGGENYEQQLQQMGLSPDELRADVRKQLSVSNVTEQKTAGKVNITDASVEAFYNENPTLFEQISARHILIKSQEQDTDEQKAEALEKITDIQKQLEEGADFAALARELSEDTGSAQRDGDLGYFGRGRMVPAFETAAFAMEPGETSEIVQSQFGYHLIKVEDRKVLSLEEVKEDVRRALASRKQQELIQQWISELFEQAEIEYAQDMGAPPSGGMGAGAGSAPPVPPQ
jgi:parvulin-like peptidyl-prolyl isomerase